MKNEEALRKLVQHRSEVFGYIMAMVRDVHDAEDLFQEVSLAVVRQAGEAGKVEDLVGWMKSIARNLVRNFWRQQRTRETLALPTEELARVIDEACEQSRPDPLVLQEEHGAMLKCLGKLRGRARHIMQLRFLQGMEYEEMSRELQQKPNAIRQAVLRTRQALLKCIEATLRGSTSDGI